MRAGTAGFFDRRVGAAPVWAQPADDGTEAAADASTADRNSRNSLRVRVRTEALRAGLPAEIADAVATVESGYNVRAVGRVGEIGLMQVLPSTARLLGFEGTLAELAVPDTNIRYGVAYLAGAWRLAESDLCTAVMKYRAGHAEARFSYRSVDYCRRVRAVLAAQGYPLFGEVPVATFGEPVTGGGMMASRVAGKRWRPGAARAASTGRRPMRACEPSRARSAWRASRSVVSA